MTDQPISTNPTPPTTTLASIDALRGFDMLWIIGGQGAFLALVALFFDPLPDWLVHQFRHVEWVGFTFWDLIMPLFLFVSGASMPFSFAKWAATGGSKKRLYLRIVRRVLILWVLGMAAQGHLLEYDLSKLHLYSNTLQSIASGYLIAAILVLSLPVMGQLISAAVLLLGYWLLMVVLPIPEHGSGVLEPTANLARYVDEVVLGRFRDGTTYTWVLSSMVFGVSLLQGVFAGLVLRSRQTPNTKVFTILAAGVACLFGGWIWSFWFPIIKHIWTSSMVLWSGGWCYLLLGLFYWVIDVKGYRKWAFPLIVIGMNAIAVYTATQLYNFDNISDIFLGNLAPFLGAFGKFLLEFGALLVPWLILLYMYRKRTFIRV